MLTESQIKSNWSFIKGGIRNMWGKISEEELDAINGNIQKLEDLVGEKYDDTPEHIRTDINKVLSSFDNESDMADHDTNESSYMRSPVDVRTSGKSQSQDKVQEVEGKTPERDVFEKESQTKLDH